MVLEQYLGPMDPFVSRAAMAIGNRMEAYGVQALPRNVLVDALVITVLVLTLSILGITASALFSHRDTRNAVLIVGISGDSDAPAVGKTAIFKALRYGALPKHGTVPSMTVNDATFIPHGLSQSTPPLRFIDFPGHPRLRHTLHTYLKMAKCIVFVVDGQRFTAQARKDAELLYDVLTDPFVAEKGTPLLVFCNKSDVTNPTKTITVQTRLAAELERARNANASTLRSAAVAADGSGNQGALVDEDERAQLGYENEAFSFDHTPGPVTFASGSALKNDVEPIINFARSSFL